MRIILVKPADRLTIVVSKKVSGKAVERNLIKRRIREAVHSFSTDPRMTIIALPPIVRKPFSEIKSAIEQSMKKI